MIIHLIVGLIKKTLYKMSQYFPKPYEPFGGDINVTVDLSNYATKDDIKNITHVDTSSFALKTNLANLKTEVDKLDIDKLAPVPADLSKLSNVVNNEVVKKTEYDAKIKNIEDKIPDISNLATKSNLNTKINEVKNEIPSITGLATITALTAVENKIPSFGGLGTISALTAVENKIPSISSLVKKTDYDINVGEIENRMIILNKKIASNKTKDISVENELKKLKTIDSSYFRGKNYFDEDGNQNYYIFQPISKYLKVASVNDINYIFS